MTFLIMQLKNILNKTSWIRDNEPWSTIHVWWNHLHSSITHHIFRWSVNFWIRHRSWNHKSWVSTQKRWHVVARCHHVGHITNNIKRLHMRGHHDGRVGWWWRIVSGVRIRCRRRWKHGYWITTIVIGICIPNDSRGSMLSRGTGTAI